ncbi:MAG: hypothetical protein Ct9H300mP12_17640 [Acidimicrobiales bacterium]|nr:MAG: hypothetical protein Ct9H300mP12_17640 [Acidimicrobiales bacterium]
MPFSWYEPMWLESLGFAELDRGWQMVEEVRLTSTVATFRATAPAGCCRPTPSVPRE